MIRALIFDCFGVLAQGTWDIFLDSMPDSVDFAALHDMNHAHDAGFVDDATFSQEVERLTGGIPPPQLEGGGSSILRLNRPVLEFIRARHQEYSFAIMSNISSDWITRELLSPEQQRLFDHIITSFEVGVAKPNRGIYQVAIERLGFDVQEIVCIDDAEENIATARKLGMNGIVYSTLTELRQSLTELGVN